MLDVVTIHPHYMSQPLESEVLQLLFNRHIVNTTQKTLISDLIPPGHP